MKQNKSNIDNKEVLPVRVSIVSHIRDMTPDEEEKSAPFKMSERSSKPEPEIETIEYKTDGVLSDDGETVSLTYSESEEMGFEEASTTLSFSRNLPGTVTMVRTGGGATACRFSETERRQHCVYNTGFMPIELIINTHAVKNDFSGSIGRISLDYTIELRGLTTERNRLLIDYRPAGGDSART